MDEFFREVGRTIRYAMESTDRTVRLIAICVVGALLIALYYLLMHQAG
jgi:hypothetical protein